MSYLNKHYIYKFCVYLILIIFFKCVQAQVQSPCPNIFEYRYDSSNVLYGFLKVPRPNDNSNIVRLDVQLSVGNVVQGFSGSINLASSRSKILEDIINGMPLMYNIIFPYWMNIPPRITKIEINDQQVCYGFPIEKGLVNIITIVNLQHTLTISMSPNPQLTTTRPPYFYTNGPNVEAPIFNFQPEQAPEIYQKPLLPQDPIYNPPEVTESNSFPNKYNPESFDKPTKKPPTLKPTNRITLSPKGPEVDDLPTVETNLIRKPFSSTCGISINTNSLLVNGNKVNKGLHPWLAALFIQNNEGLKFICGTSLISKKHVITAGHCLRNRQKKFKPEELWVVLGRENIQRWSNDGAQIIQAESTHIHPDYKFNSADGDLAIILLSEEAVFSNLIRPVCLWTTDSNPKLIVEKKGTIVGWGKDETGRFVSPEPKQISFPVVSEEDCLRSNSAFREITSNRTFCAGYRNNSGPCNGDSGSGFLMQINGRWNLRGLVSMSLLKDDGNCDLNQYIVFTDIAQYTEWIFSFL